MKTSLKTALMAATIIGFAALPALAQQDNGGGAGGGPGPGQGQQQFEDMKANILQHLKQAEACVQAANDPEALRACRPPDRGGHGGGGHGGPGGGPGGSQSGGGNDSGGESSDE